VESEAPLAVRMQSRPLLFEYWQYGPDETSPGARDLLGIVKFFKKEESG
jgi:hypothetical protein